MRETAGDRRRAGLLVLTGLAVLGLLLLLSAGFEVLTRGRRYLVIFPGSVSGLQPSSPVTYAGVPAGTVAGIRPLAGARIGQIGVEVELASDVVVKEDVRARLQPQGITGTYQLELYGGTSQAPPLEPGGVVRGDATPSLTETLAKAEEILSRLARVVRQNEEALGETVRASRDLMVEARRGVRELGETARAARRAIEGLEPVLSDPALARLPGELESTLKQLRASVEQADVPRLAREARATLAGLRRVEASVEEVTDATATHLPATLRNVRHMSRDLRAAASDVRRDPSRLVRGGPAPRERSFPDPLPPPVKEVE